MSIFGQAGFFRCSKNAYIVQAIHIVKDTMQTKETTMGKKWILPLAIVLSLLLGALGGAYYTEMTADEPLKQETKEGVANQEWIKVEAAYQLIKNQYVEKVGSTQLVEGAIQGMLATLKDPYSVYMDKQTANQFSESLDSTFEGIGTEIGVEDNKIIIVAPYKDSPSEKAGLKPRDQLLKINGESIEGLNLEEARLKIRGKKGTSVSLEIKRQGAVRPITLNITREEIPVDTVFSSTLESNDEQIGYIDITLFSEKTATDFKRQLKDLENKGIEGLIIDVRGNPGGLLKSVENILGVLIPKDKPILQIAERTGKVQTFSTELKQRKNYPIVVLTDNGSASASEILAGALQEAGGYKIIGERTFGKGTVQQAVPMGDGSNIKISLFKWLTPNGNWIHKVGIAPNIEVHQPAYFTAHQLEVDKPFERDMNDEKIKHAQEMLKAIGFVPGRTDGYFSSKTETALKAFQRHKGLKVTGELDTQTAEELTDSITEKIRDKQNDVQLRTALKIVSRE